MSSDAQNVGRPALAGFLTGDKLGSDTERGKAEDGGKQRELHATGVSTAIQEVRNRSKKFREYRIDV